MLEKMTDNNTVLETTIGQGNVKETDHDYTVKDTFDFNYVKWKENAYKEGKIDDNLYNYIRWQFAPKYGSVDDAGMPININIPKIGDGTKTTKTGAKQFDEGPKFAKKGGVRKYKTGGDGGVRHFDAGGLYHNINHKKKSGTSRSKANSTVSKKAYSNMKSGFKKKYETGGDKEDYNLPPRKMPPWATPYFTTDQDFYTASNSEQRDAWRKTVESVGNQRKKENMKQVEI